MSKLGFDQVLKRLQKVDREFILGGIELAKQEFKRNFQTESNAESGSGWKPVKRKVPPQILVEDDELRKQAVKDGTLRYFYGRGQYIIDPIDKRGKGYADYHQSGVGVAERKFATQSKDLTKKQRDLLVTLVHKAF